MGALDGFYSTWSQARETFGSGVPQDGTEFEQGTSELRRLQSSIESAKPDSRWQGAAADAYAVKNEQHAVTYGKLADLDQRMASELGRSAAVVTAGRQSLDQIHSWATNAVAALPDNQSSETMKTIIANKGIGQVTEVITRSTAEMTAIGDRVRALGQEYEDISAEDDSSGDEPQLVNDDNGQALPETTLDLDDIVQLPPYNPQDPSTFGPRGYRELVPGSGTWVPDPTSPSYQPTPVVAPLDYNDIVYQAPGELGPYGYMELVPGSGTWVPNPDSWTTVGHPPAPPEVPVDLANIEYLPPGELGPYGHTELVPGSGAWIPGPSPGPAR